MNRLSWLADVSPCFPLKGKNVSVLKEPSEFLECLKRLARNSRKRIVWASLYLGTGEKEQELVDSVETALKNSQSLKVRLLLDYTRGTRGDPNSCTMLKKLLRFGNQCEVYLFHTPKLRNWLKFLLPPRWNEVVGVQHMKIYVFDDSILISGANLSDHYFENRQDRYVLIEDNADLSDYCSALL